MPRYLTALFASLVGFSLLLGLSSADAQGKKKKKTDDDEPAASQMDPVETLEHAYALAALGKEKNWPETILAAARLLRGVGKLQAAKGEEAIEDKGEDTKDKVEPFKALTPEQESDDLIAEAIKRSEKMSKATQDGVAALAKSIKDGTRSPQAGPQYFQNMLKPNQRNVYTIPMKPGQPGRVMARSNNGAMLELTVLHDGQPLAMRVGPAPALGFMARSNPPRHTFRIINKSPMPTAFQLIIN